VLDQQKLLADLREQKTTTLNIIKRLAEKAALDQRRLAIENKRRAAKNLPAIKTWDELSEQTEKENPTQDPNFERSEERALVREAAEIAVDLATPARASNRPIPSTIKRAPVAER